MRIKITVCAVAVVIVICFFFLRNGIHGIKPGMSKEQVVAAMGDPTQVIDGTAWIYEYSIEPGWVEVNFSDDGRLSSINDERVFRW